MQIAYNRQNKTLISFLFLLSVILSILALVYRKPGAFTQPQFFAEDGTIFFQQCYEVGVRSIISPYAGYLHLIPRIAALLIFHGLSYENMPAGYNIAGLIVFLGLVCFIWLRTSFDPYIKFFLTLALSLAPVGNEIVLCLTNVQWYVNLFIPLFFLSGYNKKYAVFDGIALFLIGLTGPFCLIFLPVVVAILVFQWNKPGERKHKRWFFLIYLATALIQLSVLTFSGTRPSLGWNMAQKIGHSSRALYLQLITPLGIDGFYTEETHYRLFTVLVLILSGWIFLCWRRLRTRKDPFPLFLMLAALCDVAASVYNLHPGFFSNLHPLFAGARYFFGPFILLIWSVIIYSSGPGETVEATGKAGEIRDPSQTPYNAASISRRNVLFLLLYAYYTVVLALTIPGFTLADKNWPEQAKKIESFQKGHLEVPINPDDWKIYLDK